VLGTFTTISTFAAGNAVAMVLFHWSGYGTWRLAIFAAAHAAASAQVAEAFRLNSRRRVQRALLLWFAVSVAVMLMVARTYHLAQDFWWICGLSIAAGAGFALWLTPKVGRPAVTTARASYALH
jgi:hypothetical protein